MHYDSVVVIIINFPLILIDKRCQRQISNKIIWNCEHLLEMLGEPNLILDEQESIPQHIDTHFIALDGWKFDVSSTIHTKAESSDIIRGWNMLNKDFQEDIFGRLVQPFFVRAILDVKSAWIEGLRDREKSKRDFQNLIKTFSVNLQ